MKPPLLGQIDRPSAHLGLRKLVLIKIWTIRSRKSIIAYESSRDLIEEVSHNLSLGTGENHENPQSGWPMSPLQYERSTSRTQVTSACSVVSNKTTTVCLTLRTVSLPLSRMVTHSSAAYLLLYMDVTLQRMASETLRMRREQNKDQENVSLCLIKHHDMETHELVDAPLHIFSDSGIYGGE
jgi:hypothetical protein